MYLKRKGKSTAFDIPLSIASGVIVAWIVTIAGAALTAFLIQKQALGEGGIGLAAKVVVAIATF